VHAPVRNSSKNPTKVQHLVSLPNASKLRIFDGGDLEVRGSFDTAFRDCDAVIHTAAEVVIGAQQSIIRASVDGTNNVLSSVDNARNCTRFVQTSSIAAIQTYDKPPGYIFSESDWNDWSTVEKGDAYGVAKTAAERMVHKHFENDKERFCVCLNPGVVIGPVFTKAHTKASPIFLREIIFGNKVMNFPTTYVDVRDVALAHVNAMERLPKVNDMRFILTNNENCLVNGALDMAVIARRLFPDEDLEGCKPKYPEIIMSVARPLSMLPLVGGLIMSDLERKAQSTPVEFDNKLAQDHLDMEFRPLEETIKEGIQSMVDLGFAKFKSKI